MPVAAQDPDPCATALVADPSGGPREPDRPWPVADLVAHLTGTWRLDRRTSDLRAGTSGALRGTAVFSPRGGGGISWSERGVLRTGTYEGAAGRELLVVPDEAAWLVRFADGRPFHRLDLRTGRCAVAHPCRADRYRGEVRANGPDVLLVDWRVVGPVKDARISSRYERRSAR